MLFNSIEFIVFIAVFFAAWPLFRKRRTSRWIYLTLSSYFFYGWWDWRFLFLITGSGLIDFLAALGMERWEKRRKFFLVASILGNVGSLGVFKYLGFLTRNLNWALGVFGMDLHVPVVSLILPVGISFYTFQSMSYTFEVYSGKIRATHNVFHFFAYLSMFPQLVAGPIVRAAYLLPQLEDIPGTTEEKRWEGTKLLTYGYFKKVVLADTFAPVVTKAFAMATPAESAAYWWLIILMFAFQIYCDFSGYSDIARGLAKWMGYEFPLNFDHPYISRSIREFWSRWHISLSTWFRDYVYIPLGGSRRGFVAGLWNMWITMLVSGLWHGAAWTFVVWGALHALYVTLERVTDWPKKLGSLPAGRHVSVVLTFLLVLISWVFFRAESFSQAGLILSRMADVSQLDPAGAIRLLTVDTDPGVAPPGWKALSLLVLIMAWHVHVYLGPWRREGEVSKWNRILQLFWLAILLFACVFFRGPGSAFIYFQF